MQLVLGLPTEGQEEAEVLPEDLLRRLGAAPPEEEGAVGAATLGGAGGGRRALGGEEERRGALRGDRRHQRLRRARRLRPAEHRGVDAARRSEVEIEVLGIGRPPHGEEVGVHLDEGAASAAADDDYVVVVAVGAVAEPGVGEALVEGEVWGGGGGVHEWGRGGVYVVK